MDLKHEDKLRNNTTYLNEFLAIEEPGFLNYLNQNRLITSSKLEEYKRKAHQYAREKVNQEFVLFLMRRGPRAFQIFIEALAASDQRAIIEQLDPSEPELAKLAQEPEIESDPDDDDDDKRAIEIPIEMQRMYPTVYEDIIRKDCYYQQDKGKGCCIIINMEYYRSSNNMKCSTSKTRIGSTVDVNNCERLFKKLNYDVMTWNNDEYEVLKKKLKTQRNDGELAKVGSFVMILLAHGSEGNIHTIDNKKINIEDEIIASFDDKKCPSLKGTPKIFIVQACQGDETTVGVPVATDSCTSSLPIGNRQCFAVDTDGDAASVKPLRTVDKQWNDVILISSTVNKYKSYRDEKFGSWFICTLVSKIVQHQHQYHLVEIMEKVTTAMNDKYTTKSEKLSKKDNTLKVTMEANLKQIPVTYNKGFTKNFYFFYGIDKSEMDI